MGEEIGRGKRFEKNSGSSLSGFEEKKGVDFSYNSKDNEQFLEFLTFLKYRSFGDSANPNCLLVINKVYTNCVTSCRTT